MHNFNINPNHEDFEAAEITSIVETMDLVEMFGVVTSIDKEILCCTACKSENYIGKGHRRFAKYRDLPINNKKTLLYLRRNMFLCKDCGTWFSDVNPDIYNKNVTNRFLDTLIAELKTTDLNNCEMARKYHLHEKSIRRYKQQFINN